MKIFLVVFLYVITQVLGNTDNLGSYTAEGPVVDVSDASIESEAIAIDSSEETFVTVDEVDTSTVYPKDETDKRIESESTTEGNLADYSSQPENAEDESVKRMKEPKEDDEDVSDEELNSKSKELELISLRLTLTDDICIAKIMQEVKSILTKRMNVKDDMLQDFFGYHYAKEYEKLKMMAKLVQGDEDITELYKLVWSWKIRGKPSTCSNIGDGHFVDVSDASIEYEAIAIDSSEDTSTVNPKGATDKRIEAESTTESTLADDSSQPESAEDDSIVGKKEHKEENEDVTDEELISKVGPGGGEETVDGKENDDIGIAKIMEEVQSIFSKMSYVQDDKLLEYIGYHDAMEYEKLDEMTTKLVIEDEDVKELLNLVWSWKFKWQLSIFWKSKFDIEIDQSVLDKLECDRNIKIF